MNIKVGILFNESYDGPPDYQNIVREVENFKRSLAHLGYTYILIPVKEKVRETITDLLEGKPDVVINLCEYLPNKLEGEMYIASLLELLDIPYTGSSPKTLGLAQDKVKAKYILLASGIPTPNFQVLTNVPERELELPYPRIIKPVYEDGSLGISTKNVVYDFSSLKTQIKELLRELKEPLLVEEYIEGREFNVSILGREILPISEIDFSRIPRTSPKILTFNAKWATGSEEDLQTPAICPALLSKKEERMIKNLALKSFTALEVRDYGRVDLRRDKEGNLKVLEVNPNPDISPVSGFVRSLTAQGIAYEYFVAELIEFALSRKDCKLPIIPLIIT